MASERSGNAVEALRQLSRLKLAHLPTPLEPLPRLSALLEPSRIWVKRDDCTGLATGGNKTRKVEYLLADAIGRQADTIVTVGAIQSNHARQVAAASARLNLKCVLALMDAVPDRAPVYRTAGNVFLDQLCGAEVRIVPDVADATALLDSLAAELTQQGRRPYVIPLGGSNRLGAAAYANAFLELMDQLESLGRDLDVIIVPTVSGGTMAGLLLGAALCAWKGKILGIAAGSRVNEAAERVRAPLLAAAELLQVSDKTISQIKIEIDDRFMGAGYGIPTADCARAIQLLASNEGLLLDPVYTGKAMAG
jgi:D-cysteine desulfhydrase family pyridoxal phosphate-dependent enzyme